MDNHIICKQGAVLFLPLWSWCPSICLLALLLWLELLCVWSRHPYPLLTWEEAPTFHIVHCLPFLKCSEFLSCGRCWILSHASVSVETYWFLKYGCYQRFIRFFSIFLEFGNFSLCVRNNFWNMVSSFKMQTQGFFQMKWNFLCWL